MSEFKVWDFKRGDRVEHAELGPHGTIALWCNAFVIVWDDGKVEKLDQHGHKLIKLKGLGRGQKP